MLRGAAAELRRNRQQRRSISGSGAPSAGRPSASAGRERHALIPRPPANQAHQPERCRDEDADDEADQHSPFYSVVPEW
jgi:hypothetical protein